MIKEVHVAVANDLPKRVKFPGAILVAAALMLGGLGVSEWLKPSRVMADELRPGGMKEFLPEQFGGWRGGGSGRDLRPDGGSQAFHPVLRHPERHVCELKGRCHDAVVGLRQKPELLEHRGPST